jgi:LuxR family maltose regulon positive regulatory protein
MARMSHLVPTVSTAATPEASSGSRLTRPPGLIEAKLLVPNARSSTVRRTRLLRQIRSARDRRVISIVAPPGYGKTSLLVRWAAEDPRSVAWLTADDGDNDPVVFLTYLAAAIDRFEPLAPDIFDAISSAAVSDRAVVGRLLATLSGREQSALVVIDDAHRITDRACLDALAEFITYLPEGSQVAVAGREPVALPVARWRTDGSMLEIGPGELAMDDQEAAALASQVGLRLSPEAIRQLLRQTEGWPALLALAAGEARRSGREARIDTGRNRLITEYLRSELLKGRSEAEVTFMARTSILEQLSGPVCDAVAGRTGSAEMLEDLAHSTLLVDEYGGSYRYHSLLRDFLRAELATREPERIAGLHRQAAAWYAANGAVELAVDHAFAAPDIDLAATLMGKAMLGYHWSGRRATNRAWFRRLGDDALQERPWLAVLAAWLELSFGEVAAALRLADVAERGAFEGLPSDGTASFESGLAMLRAGMVRRGAADALANAARAVDIEPTGSRWRDFGLWQLAIARRTTGDQAGADASLADAVAVARSARNVGLAHCLLGHRALLAVDRRDWDAASAFAGESDELADVAHMDGYLATAPGLAAHARIALQRGDIVEARRVLAQAMGLRPLLTTACPAIAVQSLLAFAHAHLAAGDPSGARALIAQAGQVIRARPDLGILPGEVMSLGRTIASLSPGLSGGASSLTASELRVLALLPYYLSFKEIGQRLGVKATTVKTHAISIYGKLGASARSEAVDLAVEAGLLDPFPPRPTTSAIGEDAARPPG